MPAFKVGCRIENGLVLQQRRNVVRALFVCISLIMAPTTGSIVV